MQPKEVVDLGRMWDEWVRCSSILHQRDKYYRFGTFESCGTKWDDFSKAMSAKFSRDKEYAAKVMESTNFYRTHKKSPTIGVIWEAKDPPSWD